MDSKIVAGVLVAVIVIGGGAYLYSNNQTAPIANGEYVCGSQEHYLRISDNGIANVVDFGIKANPIPSKIYIDKGVDTDGHKSKGEGAFTIYHDDQYDPAEQKDNIPALYDCKQNGKTVFEIYGRSVEKFQTVINTSHRNDTPSEI